MRYIYFESGINREYDYPYTAKIGSCKRKLTKYRYKLSNVKIPTGYSHDALIAELQNGPFVVAIDARKWAYYKGGIMTASQCAFSYRNHEVTLFGYGADSAGNKYWLIQNSWGKWWGENGYIRLERKPTTKGNPGVCGMYTSQTAPVP